ncbi:MAG: sigma-70 family RNA polymerase sigma factor [Planctomycetota bacterium]|nr:MAG: sigma-70 family RNA polymerase sigma factor [Planctomycetota bacterium]
MTRQEEQRLLAAAARGDQEAAAACIRAHQGPLYSYILRMSGRPDVAEDVVQEAFVRVLSNLERFDSRYRFSTWLFTIARRVYLNTVQKRHPASDTSFIAQSCDASPAQDVDRADERNLAGAHLDRALRELNETQREIIILFHQFDWPISLIARHMDIPEGTVKSHLHRARRRLRELLCGCEQIAERMEDLRP